MTLINRDEKFVTPCQLRSLFAASISELYKAEVPLYSSLLDVVSKINEEALKNDPVLKTQLEESDSLSRLNLERHGAIRLGSEDELVELASFLRLLDMNPVGYYDLSVRPACLPIHATCFRSLSTSSLNISPFRLFVSLLRPELLPKDPAIQNLVQTSIGSRKLFPPEVTSLITEASNYKNELPRHMAERLIELAIPSFAFHRTSSLTSVEYSLLAESSVLLADIVAFPNPHINHLTPRTLDIDAVQNALLADKSFQAKASGIEGPPPSPCPILLRQTSFCAVEETVQFSDDKIGRHAARFGEIEQRGAALTPTGRQIYDQMISSSDLRRGLSEMVSSRTWDGMRKDGLIWVQYRPIPGLPHDKMDNLINGSVKDEALLTADQAIEFLLEKKMILFHPQIYEDFLPLSAAGIFRSNLGQSSEAEDLIPTIPADETSKFRLQQVLSRAGAVLNDEMDVYKMIQETSKRECADYFGIKIRDS